LQFKIDTASICKYLLFCKGIQFIKSLHMFTPLKLCTISIIARMQNIVINSREVKWECPHEGPIKRIQTALHDSVQPGYVSPQKIKTNTRGRKKKIKKYKTKTTRFNSNVTFIVVHRVKRDIPQIKDRYHSVAVPDGDGQIIPKEYTVKLFNKGNIISVGIIKQDKSDIIWVLGIIFDWIRKNTQWVDAKYINLQSTLENYKFKLRDPTTYISLTNMQRYYISEIYPNIRNIDIKDLYQLAMDNQLDDIDDIIRTDFERKNIFVDKGYLSRLVKKINIPKIEKQVTQLQDWFYNNNDRLVDNKFKDLVRESYYRYVLGATRAKLLRHKANQFNNIRYKPSQANVIIETTFGGINVSVKIFGSGSFNILGCKDYKTVKEVYDSFEKLFIKLKKQIIFHPDMPPMVRYDKFIMTEDDL
jgi:hypothetical protein